jgi:hypothetical protein
MVATVIITNSLRTSRVTAIGTTDDTSIDIATAIDTATYFETTTAT